MHRMLPGAGSSRPHPQANGLFLCCLITLALMPTRAWTDQGSLRLSGYVKSFAMVQVPVPNSEIRNPETGRILLNRVRFELFWRPGPGVSGEFAYELSGRIPGAPSLEASRLPAPALFDYRVKDLKTRLFPRTDGAGRGFTVTQNLDRASVTVSLPRADVYVGRQVVAFGSARAVNPTDVIAPYSPDVLDKDERVGVDAIRLRAPVGIMGELDAGIIPGWNLSKKRGAGFLRGRFFTHGTDVYVTAMRYQDNLLLGADLARSLGDAGAWLEAAWTRAAGGRSFMRISTGLDYQFSNGVYGTLEYHLNGAGVSSTRDYRSLLNDPTHTTAGVYLLGRHYVAPSLAWQLTPLWSIRVPVLWNLTDRSAFLSPAFEYGFFQDASVSGGVFYGIGGRPGSTQSGFSEFPESEFGLYPAVYFASLRYYF